MLAAPYAMDYTRGMPPDAASAILDFRVHAYEVGPEGVASVRAVCDWMQEAAGAHAEALGASMERLEAENLGWVMHRLHLRLHRRPALHERLTVETWPSLMDRVEAHRDFLVRDASGALVAEATSLWVVIRLDRRRVARLPAWIRERPVPDRPRVLGGAFPEAPAVEAPTFSKDFFARHDDLDVLGHVNNARWAAWIAESVPDAVLDGRHLELLSLVFRAEATRGERLRADSQETGAGTWAHRIRGEDGRVRVEASSRWT